jgi:hypothetical protein
MLNITYHQGDANQNHTMSPHQVIVPVIKKTKIMNTGKHTEREPLHTLGGKVNCTDAMENGMEFPSKNLK